MWLVGKRRESHRFTLNRRLYCVCINLDQIVSVVVGCHATQWQCKCQPSQAKKLGNRKTIIIIIKWVGGSSTRQKQERPCIPERRAFVTPPRRTRCCVSASGCLQLSSGEESANGGFTTWIINNKQLVVAHTYSSYSNQEQLLTYTVLVCRTLLSSLRFLLMYSWSIRWWCGRL